MPEWRLLHLTRIGWGLMLAVLFLCVVGLMCIRATERNDPEPQSMLKPEAAPELSWSDQLRNYVGPETLRQLLYILSGVGLMLLVLVPSYQRIGWYSYVLYGIALTALALLVIDKYALDLPFVPVRRNTRRWIDFGLLALQPSEIMKPVLVLALAWYLRYRKTVRTWPGLIAPFVFTLVPMLLIAPQPDLGTLLMLLPALFMMIFVAGARLRHLVTIVVLGCATLPAFYFYGMAEYQKVRVRVVLKQHADDPRWHNNEGYQLYQSKTALGTGGLLGEGFGQGVFMQHELLPEEHNDFIFAIIGHQWGFVGCLLVILAYAAIVLCGLEIVSVTNDPFGRLLAIGVIVMIVMQALLNICMVIGLAPITGMTLPFVSAGGNSLWANFIALGLLLNVAQRRPMLIGHAPFEHEEDE